MSRRLILLLLFSAVAPVAFASTIAGSVMTYVVTGTTTVEPEVEAVLSRAAMLALERREVVAAAADFTISGDEPSRRDITRLARIGGSEFVLVASYNPGQTRRFLDVTYVLYLVDPPLPVAVVQDTVRVSLLLDRAITRLIDTVLADAFESDSN